MEWVSIKQLCKIIGGKPNPKDDIAFDTIGIPFVRMRDLGKYHQTTDLSEVETFLNEDYAKKHGYKIIPKGAILIPRSGSVSLNHRAILGIDASLVSHICALEVINDKVDNYYLYYYLTLLDMGRIALKTTGLDSIPFKRIEKINIPLSPRLEQTKIVAHLNKIQDLINKRIESILLLDEYIKSVFLEMFGNPILDTYKIGKKPLSFFGNWQSGGTPSRTKPEYFDGDIPWFTSGELGDFFVKDSNEKITEDAIKYTSAKPVKNGSIMIGMYDTAALKCSISLADSSCNQAIAFCNLNIKLCYPIFVYFNILLGRDYYLQKRKGARQKNLNLTLIKNIEILYPSISLQRRFVQKFEIYDQLKSQHLQSLKFLETLFQASLQKAFSEDGHIEEENVFETLLQSFSQKDLKQGHRMQYLLNWLSKEKQHFSNFENYDTAINFLLSLLDERSIEQVLDNDKIKLKVKK